MGHLNRIRNGLIAFSIAGAASNVFALDGMYDIGYGAPSKGIGGAAVAFPQDTLTAVANPANLVPVGTRIDLAPEYLRGTRTWKIRNNAFLPEGSIRDWDLSRNKNIIAGEGGISYLFQNFPLALGLLVTPQSGGILKWNHPIPLYPAGKQDFHINIMYVAFTPTIGVRFLNSDVLGKHFLGAGVDFTVARLKIEGLQSLQNLGGIFGGTLYPNYVTNKGFDWAYGWAVRVGYLAQIRPWISVGVAYRTKSFMSEFDKYKGAITPHGRANLPATLFGGIALKPLRQTTIAFDVGCIFNGDVSTFANPPFTSADPKPHGASDGAGFGWKSQMVYKVGIAQEITDAATVRVGYNYGEIPWKTKIEDVVLGASFLPSTVRHHLTCGGSLSMGPGIVSASFVWGLKHSIKGPMAFEQGGGETTVTSNLYGLEVQFSKVW